MRRCLACGWLGADAESWELWELRMGSSSCRGAWGLQMSTVREDTKELKQGAQLTRAKPCK